MWLIGRVCLSLDGSRRRIELADKGGRYRFSESEIRSDQSNSSGSLEDTVSNWPPGYTRSRANRSFSVSWIATRTHAVRIFNILQLTPIQLNHSLMDIRDIIKPDITGLPKRAKFRPKLVPNIYSKHPSPSPRAQNHSTEPNLGPDLSK